MLYVSKLIEHNDKFFVQEVVPQKENRRKKNVFDNRTSKNVLQLLGLKFL